MVEEEGSIHISAWTSYIHYLHMEDYRLPSTPTHAVISILYYYAYLYVKVYMYFKMQRTFVYSNVCTGCGALTSQQAT